MKLPRNQILILGLLTIIVAGLCTFGLGLLYNIYQPRLVLGDEATPTEPVALPPTAIALASQAPTKTMTFTPIATQTSNSINSPYKINTPTQVIYPSLTPITPVPKNTQVVNTQPQNPPQQSAPQQNPNPSTANDCAPKLAYVKSMHEYKLSNIQSIYEPLISFYEDMIRQAVADRDAISLVEYQRKLDSQKKQLDADIKAENKRYQSEVSYINSTCK